jgi:hypothetical protein
MTTKSGFGNKDGKQKGLKKCGRKQNHTSKCRNPGIKRKK